MKPVNLSLSDGAVVALSCLPSYTKSPFASTSIAATFGLLVQSIKILCHEPPERQGVVIAFSRVCASTFGADCMRVLIYDRFRVDDLLSAHGSTYADTLDATLTNVALVLGSVLDGAPKVFRGMIDPLSKV